MTDRSIRQAPTTNPRGWRRNSLGRRELITAALLMLAAIIVRWPYVAHGRTVLHSDEAIVGLMADDIAHGRQFPTYFYGQRYMGALEAYVIAGLQRLGVEPMTALRLGPTLFFSLLVGVQYIMLTRWFGRFGGLIGAATLLASPPWIMRWTVVARGGYVEIMLWGSLLWWAYGEWFVGRENPKGWQKATLGAIIGSGLWLNPTIVAFVAPVVVHWLLGKPMKAFRHSRIARHHFRRMDRTLPRWPIVMPLVVGLLVTILASVCAVQITDQGVEYLLLSGLVPQSVAVLMIGLVVGTVGVIVLRRTNALPWLRSQLNHIGPLVLGTVAGLTPAIAYVVYHTVTQQPLEDCLPLGFRPMWTVGETLGYVQHGLPLLFGADPSPMVELIQTGRAHSLESLTPLARQALILSSIVGYVCLVALAAVFVGANRREIWSLLRMRGGQYSPRAFLLLSVLGFVGLYLVSGCSLDFTSVRYLVPLWCAIPGILACVVLSDRMRYLASTCVGVALSVWTVGQLAFFVQLGAPHPLSELANALRTDQIERANAETLDAHLLSYLTRQECRIAEFQPFWSRLGHYSATAPSNEHRYLVRTATTTWSWHWPGPAPVQTQENLLPTIRAWVQQHPGSLVGRRRLTDQYELWTLHEQIPETFSSTTLDVVAR